MPVENKLIEDKNFQVAFERYPATTENKEKRTVIILPPTGGINFLDRSYARGLSRRGADVLVLKSHTGEKEKSIDLGLHERIHSAALRGFAMMLDSVPKDHEVSVMGTSLGGLYAAIAVNRHPEVKRALIIGAGAPIPKVIAESTTEGMIYLRKKRAQEFTFDSPADYAAAIAKRFTLDPLSTGEAFRTKDLGMIIFTEDTAVPTKYQKELRDFWQPKLLIERENSHFWGIVQTWLQEYYQVLGFLLAKSPDATR